MTRDEFANVLELQTALWPHSRRPPKAAHIEVVYSLWQPLGYEGAVEALRALAADGREHAPPPGVVVAKVAERQNGDRIDFDSVWEAFGLANRLGAFHEIAGDDARAEFDQRAPDDVAAFVARHYRDYAMSGGPDGDPVGVLRAQLRQLWEQAQGRRQSQAAHDLAGVTPIARLRRVDAPAITDGGAA